jgi:phospholipid/cholesterol/gamma-HCH transport system substrate-binding protein
MGGLRRYAPRIVASLCLGVAAVLLLIAFSSGGGSYTIKAEFDDVRGLIPGAPVRAGAVPVGVVDAVDLVDDRPVATMTINTDFRLHEGATADVQLFSNAGAVNRTIELTRGDPTAPELDDGATLVGARTDQPVNFDDAAETLNKPTRQNLKQLIIGLDASLEGRGEDFDRALQSSSKAVNEIANLLAQVNSDGLALKTLVSQGAEVTSALASSPGDLAQAADSTASLLTVTAGRQNEISRSVRLLGPSLARGREALDELAAAAPRLRTLVAELGPVADELGPFARALPPALTTAGPFLDETRLLVVEAPENLRDFVPVIAAAHNVSKDLGKLINEVLPLGNSLRAYIPDTVGFFQNLGSSLGTYDANGHVLNIAAGVYPVPPASSTANELGPDDCGPGALKAPFLRSPGALECEPWTDYEDSFVVAGGGGG